MSRVARKFNSPVDELFKFTAGDKYPHFASAVGNIIFQRDNLSQNKRDKKWDNKTEGLVG